MGKITIHIGLDDTDSQRGMCTTYLTSLLIPKLLEEGAEFTDYPNLIRLNPNIPWKTRGNAAIALRLLVEEPKAIYERVVEGVEEYADVECGSNPGVVMLKCSRVPDDVKRFGELALHQVVRKAEAKRLIHNHSGLYTAFGDGRGIVGALAAIGNTLQADHTYELIAYRPLKLRGRERGVDEDSVIQMSRETYPQTFNNYDPEAGRVLITPRGPDPVLFGVRGEGAEAVLKAARMVKTSQPIERYTIFRTNQATGLHLTHPLELPLKPYHSGYLMGRVVGKPIAGRGGHIYFMVECGGVRVWCAAYEPSGGLRRVASRLMDGDLVEVGGGVRRRSVKHPAIVNVEYLKILKLTPNLHYRNPICRLCGRRMVSEGRGKGYGCPHCGYRDRGAEKIPVEEERSISLGLHLPPPRSQRHLTKPLQRFGREKKSYTPHLIPEWYGLGGP